jgi:hypothetical protein
VLREWSTALFASLARRASGARAASNPVYNLLPDMLSQLGKEMAAGTLAEDELASVMKASGCFIWFSFYPVLRHDQCQAVQ